MSIKSKISYSLLTLYPLSFCLYSSEASADDIQIKEIVVEQASRAAEGDKTFSNGNTSNYIDKKKMQRTTARVLADLVEDTPGVKVTQTRSDPGVIVAIRGMQDYGRVGMSVDGIRHNFQEMDLWTAEGSLYVAPELLVAVEIDKAGNAKMGGLGALAGTVDFRTIGINDVLDENKKFGSKIGLIGGTNGLKYSAYLATAARVKPNFSMMLAASKRRFSDFKVGQKHIEEYANQDSSLVDEYDTDKKYSRQDVNMLLYKASWNINEQQQLDFYFSRFSADYNRDPKVDATQSDDEEDETSHKIQGKKTFTLINSFSLRHNWNYSDNANLSSMFYILDGEKRKSINSNSLVQALEQNKDITYGIRTYGLSIENSNVFNLFKRDMLFTAGAEYMYDNTRTKSAIYQNTGTAEDEVKLNLPIINRTYKGLFPQGTLQQLGFYGNLFIPLANRLDLELGLRYDGYSLTGTGNRIIGTEGVDGFPGYNTEYYEKLAVEKRQFKLLPSARIVWEAMPEVKLFAKYSQSMRPPNIGETLIDGVGNLEGQGATFAGQMQQSMNPVLLAETMNSFELGVNILKQNLWQVGDKLRFKQNLFYNRSNNYIMAGLINMNANYSLPDKKTANKWAFVNNLGGDVFKGIELQGDYENSRLLVEASAAFVKSESLKLRYNMFPFGGNVSAGHPSPIVDYMQLVESEKVAYAGGILAKRLYPPIKFMFGTGIKLFNEKLLAGFKFTYETLKPITYPEQLYIAVPHDNKKLDFYLNYQINKNTQLRLLVDNALDRAMGTSSSRQWYNFMPGRTFTLNFDYKF